jgi:hypothetical protein
VQYRLAHYCSCPSGQVSKNDQEFIEKKKRNLNDICTVICPAEVSQNKIVCRDQTTNMCYTII